MKLDRRNQIIDLITQQRTVKNTELMERFDISIETVRRDLEYLEQQGHLKRVYGGAVLNTPTNSEPEYANRAKVRYRQKLAIAAEAAKLVKAGDAVYLGVGTTVQAMVQHLKNAGELTVFTNALRTAAELAELPNCSVILSGGRLRPKELTMSGYPAQENFGCFHVDTAFVGIGGITLEGVTDYHIDEASLHRQLVKNARQAVVLADSGKLGIRALVKVCDLEDVDILITDSDAPQDLVQALENAGIRVILAQI